jgi:hypothetical protein
MTRPASTRALGNEFDSFLFAPIGSESNGALLSVVSALARMNIDPWQEAAQLAKLPKDAAAERLTGLIAGLPDPPQTTTSDVVRLVAFLPRETAPPTPQGQVVVAGKRVDGWRVLYVLLLMALVAMQVTLMITREPQTSYGESAGLAPDGKSIPHIPENP